MAKKKRKRLTVKDKTNAECADYCAEQSAALWAKIDKALANIERWRSEAKRYERAENRYASKVTAEAAHPFFGDGPKPETVIGNHEKKWS